MGRFTPLFLITAFAVAAISSTMRPASGLAITFGAYCGSIRTTSAPVERIFLRPARIRSPCMVVMWPRITELVPSCHNTRSGLTAITALSKRLSMSGTSSPPTP